MAITPALPADGQLDYLAALNQTTDLSRAAPDQSLGQTDFLRLLTTQLANQDPTQPMDAKDMITDLTGFNQLEATLKLNEGMQQILAGFAGLQTMQAASLIGKSVQVQAQQLYHEAGTPEDFKLVLDQPLSDVRVVIGDSSGLVREISLGALQKGEQGVSWDGLDLNGGEAPAGDYTITAYGTDVNGEVQTISTIVAARVNSVGLEPGGKIKLTLDTGEVIDMKNVRSISG